LYLIRTKGPPLKEKYDCFSFSIFVFWVLVLLKMQKEDFSLQIRDTKLNKRKGREKEKGKKKKIGILEFKISLSVRVFGDTSWLSWTCCRRRLSLPRPVQTGSNTFGQSYCRSSTTNRVFFASVTQNVLSFKGTHLN
jgi:hypothetical protein